MYQHGKRTCITVVCMHAGMYKYTQGPCASLSGEARSVPMINSHCVVSHSLPHCYLCAKAGKISRQSTYMTVTRKTRRPACKKKEEAGTRLFGKDRSAFGSPGAGSESRAAAILLLQPLRV